MNIEIDRTFENSPEDREVVARFEDGFKLRFWWTGLSDEEYKERARIIRDKEINQSKFQNPKMFPEFWENSNKIT